MGGGRWDAADWTATRSAYSHAAKPTVDHIYTSRNLVDDLNPAKFGIRESRDSDANPSSTALIVALDVTGSMGFTLDHLAREGLGNLVSNIYDRKPITDPHIMVMGVGDFECDKAPLQVTQFEAQNAPLTQQMEKVYLERGGGGNDHESYTAPWFFAATRTSIDCFVKRGKRGYLFTVGDEEPNPKLFARNISRVMGERQVEARDYTANELLEMVSTTYEVFHVIVEEGSHYRSDPDGVRAAWTNLLGQHALFLSDHKKLAELVVSAIEIAEGRDKDDVVKSWDGHTSSVVAKAVGALVPTGNHPPTANADGMKLIG